jgi:hypothetical protein
MSHESEDKRPSTARTLVQDNSEPQNFLKSEPDVLIVDWQGPDDPENPKKCVLYEFAKLLQC